MGGMEVYKTLSVLISGKDLSRLNNVISAVTLVILYYTLYRIHLKCGVLLEISITSHMAAFARSVRGEYRRVDIQPPSGLTATFFVRNYNINIVAILRQHCYNYRP